MEKLKKISKIFSKILVISIFIVLAGLSSEFHEPWSDEAQSFLIARDTSLSEVLSYMKYEGTPPLWVFILKLFIFLGGTYETLYILPIFFSTIGLIIFEFKIKAPWYIKLLFPFSYFILYQYTIIARSYCLIFPVLMLLALVYNKRFERPILYSIVLYILMNISLHTLIIAGSLYLIYLIEVVKDKKYKTKKISIACILIFITLAVTVLITLPAEDCVYMSNGGKNFLYVITEETIGNDEPTIIQGVITVLFLITLYIIMRKKDNKDFFEISILFLPLLAFFMIVTCQKWHIGIVWILFVSYLIMKDIINKDLIAKIFVTFICVVQVIWTFKSYKYDIFENYSASKNAAEFIKQYNYEELYIYGLGYSVTAIQPYFEKNIFDNKESDKAFNLWKVDGNYSQTEKFVTDADIYVLSTIYLTEEVYENIKKIDENLYEKYKFSGNIYVKDDIYEAEEYIILVKK